MRNQAAQAEALRFSVAKESMSSDFAPIRRDIKPRSGWKFIDPNTSQVYGPHPTLEALGNQIAEARKKLLLPPIEELNQKIYNYVALLPENKFQFAALPLSRTIGDYARGIRNAPDILMATDFVDIYEAERRAKICLNCPFNGELRVTSADRILDNRIVQRIGTRSVPQEGKLHHCRICKCILKAKIWFKQEFIQKTMDKATRDKLPDGQNTLGNDGRPFTCWQLDAAK